jgi:hypothetical protein
MHSVCPTRSLPFAVRVTEVVLNKSRLKVRSPTGTFTSLTARKKAAQPTGPKKPKDRYKPSGTLGEWRKEVSAYAVGNSRPSLLICLALAAPLLAVAGEAMDTFIGAECHGNILEGWGKKRANKGQGWWALENSNL